MQDNKIYARIFVNFLLAIGTVLLIIFFLPKVLKFFMPFVIALIISSIANPFIRFMEKKIKMVRKHSSAIMIVLVLGGVVGLLYLLIAFLVKQVINLYEDRYILYEEVRMLFDNFTNNLEGIFVKLPIDMQETLNRLQEGLASWAESFLASIELPNIGVVGSYVGSIVDVLFLAIITILAAYFLTAERDNMGAWLARVLPKSVLTYYDMIVSSFKKAVGGYFKAQFKIMLILVLIMFLGFELLDIGYSFLFATLIAFLDFLPIFGTGAVFWPWIVIDMIAGQYKQAIFLGILYLVCQLIKQILQPKMVGDSIGMNPLAALFYMFIGYRFGGLLGMIVGIPIGMILVSLYQEGMFDSFLKGIQIIVHDINEFRKY